MENTREQYFDHGDVLPLLLVAAGKTNRFDELVELIETLESQYANGQNTSNANLMNTTRLTQYKNAALNQEFFVPYYHELQTFIVREDPMTLEDIEEQIKRARKDLLKEDNKIAKVDYQLHFLFQYGSSEDFISLYEQNHKDLIYQRHLEVAIIYATINNLEKSRIALTRYFHMAYDWKPIEPFLSEQLLHVLDEDFVKSLALGTQQN